MSESLQGGGFQENYSFPNNQWDLRRLAHAFAIALFSLALSERAVANLLQANKSHTLRAVNQKDPRSS